MLWGTLSHFHEEELVEEHPKVRTGLPQFVKERCPRVPPTYGPGVDEEVGEACRRRRRRHELLQRGFEENSTTRSDHPAVNSILPWVRQQESCSKTPECSSLSSSLDDVQSVSQDGVVDDKGLWARQPKSLTIAPIYKSASDNPAATSQGCHHLLAHAFFLPVHMGHHMGHPGVPFIFLNDTATQLPDHSYQFILLFPDLLCRYSRALYEASK